MRSEMVLLRERVEDKEKENAQLSQQINHLELTIDTICVALKKRGLVISVQGEMVNIEDKRREQRPQRASARCDSRTMKPYDRSSCKIRSLCLLLSFALSVLIFISKRGKDCSMSLRKYVVSPFSTPARGVLNGV
jgi:hypothetical protein